MPLTVFTQTLYWNIYTLDSARFIFRNPFAGLVCSFLLKTFWRTNYVPLYSSRVLLHYQFSCIVLPRFNKVMEDRWLKCSCSGSKLSIFSVVESGTQKTGLTAGNNLDDLIPVHPALDKGICSQLQSGRERSFRDQYLNQESKQNSLCGNRCIKRKSGERMKCNKSHWGCRSLHMFGEEHHLHPHCPSKQDNSMPWTWRNHSALERSLGWISKWACCEKPSKLYLFHNLLGLKWVGAVELTGQRIKLQLQNSFKTNNFFIFPCL